MNIRKSIAIAAVATATVLSMVSFAQAQAAYFKPLTNVVKPAPKSVASDPEIGVCFYTKVNFEGRYFCERGLRRVNQVDEKWRDRIQSVRVINQASVTICEEFNRQGTCQTLGKDSPELAPELFDHLYSYKIKQ